MGNELLIFIEKHTDTLIEQTKTKPQETLEYKLNKQTETSSFSPRTNLLGEGKLLLAVTSFEASNTVFFITNGNKSFSIIIGGFWTASNYLQERIELLIN